MKKDIAIKEGEIWLVGTKYSWGKCLVEITNPITKGEYFIGTVIDVVDVENNDEIGKQWCFSKKELICKIEGVRKK